MEAHVNEKSQSHLLIFVILGAYLRLKHAHIGRYGLLGISYERVAMNLSPCPRLEGSNSFSNECI